METRSPGQRRAPDACALLLLPGLLAAVCPMAAQAPAAPPIGSPVTSPPGDTARPVVGLVLSGGGARGLAHIGVLEILEDARVPVDLVVGTSMGAIVGGLFAAGVSPGEMRAWLRSVDWGDLFNDEPSYRRLTVRRKRLAREFPIGLELGIGPGGIQVPSGLVSGQKLNRELRRLTFPVAGVDSFDELPIPFRAVATDLTTGEMVVLSRGDLVGALRASMSVPGFFTPYAVEGRLMVDGGIVRNIPVDVARAMGAEVVIVVDVSGRLSAPAELRSVIDVTEQVTTIATKAGSLAHLAALGPADILIRPELEDISATSFERGLEAADIGRRAAGSVYGRLAPLAVGEAEFRARRKAGLARRRAPETVTYLATGSTYRRGSRHLLDRLRIRPGEPLDTTALRQDMDRIFSSGIYALVDYRIAPAEGGDLLYIDAREKAWGPSYLRFRLAIEDDFSGGSSYSFATNLLIPEVNRGGGEINLQAQVGDTRRLRLEFHQPLEPTRAVFVEPYGELARVPLDLYEEGRRIARYRVTNRTAGVALGVELGGVAEARFRVEAGEAWARPEIGRAELPAIHVDRAGIGAELIIDQVDDAYIPREGTGLFLAYRQELEGLGADSDFRLLTADLMRAFRSGAYTLLASGAFGTALGTQLPDWVPVGGGGFLFLSGHARGEVRGNYLAIGRAIFMRELGGPDLIGALSVEAGNAWQQAADIDFTDPLLGSALALGVRTLVGPLYLGLGFGEGGRRQAYFLVGRGI